MNVYNCILTGSCHVLIKEMNHDFYICMSYHRRSDLSVGSPLEFPRYQRGLAWAPMMWTFPTFDHGFVKRGVS